MIDVLKHKKYHNILILVCALVYTIAYVGRLNFSSSMIVIIEEFGSTKQVAGLVASFFFFSYGAGQIVNGILSKFTQPKYMIIISLVLSSIMNLTMTFMSSLELMKYIWALNGFAQSMLWCTLIKMISEYIPSSMMNKSIIIMGATVAVGTFLAYCISSLSSFLGLWRLSFYVPALLLIIAAVIWYFCITKVQKSIPKLDNIINAQKPLSENPLRTNNKKYRIPAYTIFVLVLVCMTGMGNNFTEDGITTWVPNIIKDIYEIPAYFSILLSLLLPIMSMFGTIVSQMIYKLVKNHFIVCVCLFTTSSLALITIMNIMESSLAGVLICLSIVSCGMSGVNSVVTSAIPLTLRTGGNSGLFAGIINGFCYAGSALASYLLGYIADNSGWNLVFIILLAISVFYAVLLLLGVFIKDKNKSLSIGIDSNVCIDAEGEENVEQK